MFDLLADPKARRAYVVAKLAVFAVATLATIALARIMGPKAWLALAIFGGILLVMTVLVLFLARLGASSGPGAVTLQEHVDVPAEDPEEVVLPVEDFIDLHPFPPRDIPEVVLSYLETAVDAGFTEVRLIHGRGVGVQRQRVREALKDHPDVISYSDATPDRGGWGATVVQLVSQ